VGDCRYGGNPCYSSREDGQKRVVLLATTSGKEAQRVSALEGKLVAMRQA
jgi:hypothetical protein